MSRWEPNAQKTGKKKTCPQEKVHGGEVKKKKARRVAKQEV